MDAKKVRKRPYLPTHCFYISLGIYLRFPTRGPIPNAPKTFFHRRSHSKGPNRALEQVQTNETPCTSWRTSCLPLPIRWAPVGRQFETTHASHCRAPPSVPWTSASANSWKGWTGRRNSWPNWSISSPWPPPSFSFVFSSAGVVHQERRIRHQRHCAAVNSGFLGGQQQHKSPLQQPPTTPHTIRTWLPQAPSTASQHDTQPEPLLRTLWDTLMQSGLTRGLDVPRTPPAPGSGSLVRRRTRLSFCDADLVRTAVQDRLRLRIPFLVTDTQGLCAAKIWRHKRGDPRLPRRRPGSRPPPSNQPRPDTDGLLQRTSLDRLPTSGKEMIPEARDLAVTFCLRPAFRNLGPLDNDDTEPGRVRNPQENVPRYCQQKPSEPHPFHCSGVRRTRWGWGGGLGAHLPPHTQRHQS